MNFIYISPQFPKSYWNFCDRLKMNGVNVLGIGDTPYEELSYEIRSSLREYFYVRTMDNYDEMLRAVAFFTYKYGKIDWLESNNEYWLTQDARLRSDFHITTGYQEAEVQEIKHKSSMKKYYEKANVPCARWHLVSDLLHDFEFVKTVGYPIIVKPDIGVGASATYKLNNDEELMKFYENIPKTPYIMEEFVPGEICSYDGIANSKKEILFDTSHVFPTAIMDIVNSQDHLCYYSVKEIPEDLKEMGKRVVEAFSTQQRFFHFEFFRLLEDKEGLGKKGELIALEVNMRPPGGYTPDMMNFANEVDVYQIWADMVCYDTTDNNGVDKRPYICVFASRRDGKRYLHNHDAILKIYHHYLMQEERMPEVLAGAMGNQMYTACFKTMNEVNAFVRFVQQLEVESDEN